MQISSLPSTCRLADSPGAQLAALGAKLAAKRPPARAPKPKSLDIILSINLVSRARSLAFQWKVFRLEISIKWAADERSRRAQPTNLTNKP